MSNFLNQYATPLADYARLSQGAGARRDYVQGGGGNTSVKLDDRLMAVKASGFCLSDVKPDSAYAVMDYSAIRAFYRGHEATDFADAEKAGSDEAKANTVSVEGLAALRPSVEAGFHSLLGTFVIHSHSVYANLACCAMEMKQALTEALAGADFSWGMVPYIDPGARLSFAIRDEMDRVSRETGKTPTDKTAGSGHQNLHCNPRLAWLMRHSSSARCGIAGHISDRTHPAIGQQRRQHPLSCAPTSAY